MEERDGRVVGGEGLGRGHVIGGGDIIGGEEGNVIGERGGDIVGDAGRDVVKEGEGHCGGRGHDSGRVQSSRGDGTSVAPTSVSGSIILLTVTCVSPLLWLVMIGQ